MTYDELVALARKDDGIVGLVLTGSRGARAAVTETSDWDVRLVVDDAVAEEYRSQFATPRGSRLEIVVLALSEFERAGELGTSTAWDRPSYLHAQVVVDTPAGLLARVLDRKRRVVVR